MAQRLTTRTGNDYGKTPDQLTAALAYVDTVEPLLRASADTIIETTRPPSAIADEVLRAVARGSQRRNIRESPP